MTDNFLIAYNKLCKILEKIKELIQMKYNINLDLIFKNFYFELWNDEDLTKKIYNSIEEIVKDDA